MLGELISAGTKLLGGFLGQNAAQKERGIQINAAKSGVQWRVADSLKAGIHPLFGLGASVSSPAPVVTGQMGEAVADTGQDIGRAVEAYKSGDERAISRQVQALEMRRMGLENTLIEEQIRSERNRSVGSPPPFPSISDRGDNPSGSVMTLPDGKTVTIPPATSANDVENELGEGAGDLYGAMRTIDTLAKSPAARRTIYDWMVDIASRANENMKDPNYDAVNDAGFRVRDYFARGRQSAGGKSNYGGR